MSTDVWISAASQPQGGGGSSHLTPARRGYLGHLLKPSPPWEGGVGGELQARGVTSHHNTSRRRGVSLAIPGGGNPDSNPAGLLPRGGGVKDGPQSARGVSRALPGSSGYGSPRTVPGQILLRLGSMTGGTQHLRVIWVTARPQRYDVVYLHRRSAECSPTRSAAVAPCR